MAGSSARPSPAGRSDEVSSLMMIPLRTFPAGDGDGSPCPKAGARLGRPRRWPHAPFVIDRRTAIPLLLGRIKGSDPSLARSGPGNVGRNAESPGADRRGRYRFHSRSRLRRSSHCECRDFRYQPQLARVPFKRWVAALRAEAAPCDPRISPGGKHGVASTGPDPQCDRRMRRVFPAEPQSVPSLVRSARRNPASGPRREFLRSHCMPP